MTRTGVASAYGAAGSLAVALVWVYYSAQILLFGAEFTRVQARRHGSACAPARGAVAISEEALARQGITPPAPPRPPGRKARCGIACGQAAQSLQ